MASNIMRTSAQYSDQLKALLPPGKLWEGLCTSGSLFNDLLAGLSKEYARIDVNSQRLIDESNPLQMVYMLAELERFAQLPDDCIGAGSTLVARQNILHSKLVLIGGADAQYFIDLAASFGYQITIDDNAPYQSGVMFNGVELTLNDWQYVWIVNGPSSVTNYFTVLSGVNQRLTNWDTDYPAFECLIRRNSPAHTVVLFSYV